MLNELNEADFDEGLDGYTIQAEGKIRIFDYLLGSYIVAMIATNYTAYNDLLSNIGMAIPVLFIFSLFFSRYHFQREFFALVALYLWVLLGALTSEYRLLSIFSMFYFLKVQFVMIVVALRCNSFRRMRFYLATLAIGTAFLVVPSLYSKAYLQLDVRLLGTVGEPNALATITACSFVAWGCLLFSVRGRWKWVVFPAMAIISFRVLLLTGSRGGFVTVMFFIAAAYWYMWRQGGLTTKFFFTLLFITLSMVILIFAKDLPIIRRFAGIPIALGFESDIEVAGGLKSAIARLEIIREALKVFSRYPILGAGCGTFRVYSAFVFTHTTPFDFLYGTGIVGTFLYYFVIVSGWFVLARAKKLGKHDPEIVKNITICQILIIAQLAAGLSLPNHSSKIQATLSGVWLGIAWYMRSWTKEQLRYQYSDEADFELAGQQQELLMHEGEGVQPVMYPEGTGVY